MPVSRRSRSRSADASSTDTIVQWIRVRPSCLIELVGAQKALVYVAAFAPEPDEVLAAPGAKFAPPALSSALVPDAAGFLYVDRAKFHDAICKDVPAADARVIAATQKPVSGSVFTTSVPGGAWKTIPSWYIVASEDQAINPELERF